MKCPIDDSQLIMSERAGVEIDYCPQCRGVWLDRGELDKIVERSFAGPSIGTASDSPERSSRDDHGDSRQGQNYTGERAEGRKRKKESWLSELFD
ncbi:TFIIB-type zinc ribbon-containing protein [Cryobacterium zhongshanensis]|uniref:Zf-TFIIB domain-containing protein n=1 Tax=Cryobacterium zhongshanensis TaxID=2928153 RepID=A0AA41UL19_9MICO|nr:zf-TFIIB domain-containing protein [Cryobacterium zhongshanensis]MCI4658476.1 zf-TFIIB domain-containing protein [Cryobacterium zhongshanensis]